jgi:hypothetical protein
MKTLTEDVLSTMTPEEIIEEGLGLVSRGMFREGCTNKNPKEAASMGWSVVSVVRDMCFDLEAQARKAKKNKLE